MGKINKNYIEEEVTIVEKIKIYEWDIFIFSWIWYFIAWVFMLVGLSTQNYTYRDWNFFPILFLYLTTSILLLIVVNNTQHNEDFYEYKLNQKKITIIRKKKW